jgi:uncharacterized membrane protein YgdD (TMEM256/DUF423 family)
VALGAFAAHALKSTLPVDMVAVFETGVRYQMYHAFALFAAACGYAQWQARFFRLAGGLFVLGIFLFSGSLYLLAITGARWLGAITPLGGISFMVGWASLAYLVASQKSRARS